jgi:hypothetical protein
MGGVSVVNPQWPGRSLVCDELSQVPRRQAFKDAYPGARFERIGSQYVGSVPYTDQGMELSITMRGDSYRVVLDALEEYFSDADMDPG